MSERVAKPVQPQTEKPKGVLAQSLSWTMGVIGALLVTIAISVVVELTGIAAGWWHGGHAAGLLFVERGYIEGIEQIPLISFKPVVVADHATPPEVLDALGEMDCRVVRADGEFNFSLRCNEGAAAATGDVLLFLNDDTLVEQEDWLDTMVGFLAEPDVGVVGARLPQRTMPLHAVEAGERVHQRVLERVAHVQRARHVGRRDYDAIARTVACRREQPR